MILWFKALTMILLIGVVSGCLTQNEGKRDPRFESYTLQADRTWQMNLPNGERFDASGLYQEKSGALLTESDQHISVYRIKFLPGGKAVDLLRIPDCFTPEQLAPFDAQKHGRYDCEGVTEDAEGRIYLCEEGDRLILCWNPRTKRVDRLNIDWSPVEKYFSDDRNAAWEGIAIHGSTMYVANERKKGRIIVVDLNTLKVVDSFVVKATFSWWFWDAHYSDLCWFDGALYVLMREDHVILKVEPATHTVLAEYNFADMEHDPEVDYHNPIPMTGVMEGLAVDRNYFWLCTDNNGRPRKNYPHDTRPTLFRCPRPDILP